MLKSISLPTRKWRRLLIAVTVTLICVTVTLLLYSSLFTHHSDHGGDQDSSDGASSSSLSGVKVANHKYVQSQAQVEPQEFILDQPSCRIPRTQIVPEYFKEGNPGAWHVSHMPNCSYEHQLVILEEEDEDSNEILRLLYDDDSDGLGTGVDLNDPPSAGKCCVSEITRRNPISDHGYRLSSCERLQKEIPAKVHGKQMLVVKCGSHLNFVTTIPTDTPAVKAKLAHWNERLKLTPNPSLPISVLIIGLESTSRSHAFRSLPRTLDYMTSQMDFIDFQGFHSAHHYTMGNFAPLFIGIPMYRVRQTCAPDWTSAWSTCPLIWKEFDKAHYVTMYLEDGPGSFSFGGQGGFTNPPTDYYIHPLFEALTPLRRPFAFSLDWLQKVWPFSLWDPWTSWDQFNQGYCMSNETVPQFMLRYLRRFVDKFNPKVNAKSNTKPPPFFSFTFLAYPFHQNMYSLPTMDQELFDFMQHLNSDHLRPLLESTLIVLLGDHGDRYTFFQSDSMEAYIERSMPPLFIRVPELLRRRFPDYIEALKWNAAHRLVTQFDFHHTMRHLLHLDSKNFTPVLGDRSSLFHRVGGDRTCEQLNVQVCVCNLNLNPESLSQPAILNELMSFVETALNQFVVESGYEQLCAKWTTAAGGDWIISARILQKTIHKIPRWKEPTGTLWLTLEVLLKFKADPLGALFEVKVRLQLDGLGQLLDGTMEVLGNFTRINLYGKQSACIPGKTDRDKKMKELCVCRDYIN